MKQIFLPMDHILKSADTKAILRFVTERKIASDRKFINYFTRALNYFIDQKDLTSTKTVWKISKLEPTRIKSLSLGILAIRTLLLEDQFESGLKVYILLLEAKQTRKRHLSLLLDYLCTHGEYTQAVMLYMNYMLPNYVMDCDDVMLFLAAPSDLRNQILSTVINQPLMFSSLSPSPTTTANLASKLKLISFTQSELVILNNMLQECFKTAKKGSKAVADAEKFRNWYQLQKQPTHVIDGANILYYGSRCRNTQSYFRLNTLIHHILSQHPGSQIQLILHRRHLNVSKLNNISDKPAVSRILDSWTKIKKLTIYKTPFGVNDDLFSIMSAINNQAHLITNDKFRDHIFRMKHTKYNLDLMAQWCQERLTSYTFKKSDKQVLLSPPVQWSTRVQETPTEFLLPINYQSWHIITK